MYKIKVNLIFFNRSLSINNIKFNTYNSFLYKKGFKYLILKTKRIYLSAKELTMIIFFLLYFLLNSKEKKLIIEKSIYFNLYIQPEQK